MSQSEHTRSHICSIATGMPAARVCPDCATRSSVLICQRQEAAIRDAVPSRITLPQAIRAARCCPVCTIRSSLFKGHNRPAGRGKQRQSKMMSCASVAISTGKQNDKKHKFPSCLNAASCTAHDSVSGVQCCGVHMCPAIPAGGPGFGLPHCARNSDDRICRNPFDCTAAFD